MAPKTSFDVSERHAVQTSVTRTVFNGTSQKAVTVSSTAGTTIIIAAAATSSAAPVWASFSYGAKKHL